jgi:branched-chain amino acid transport system ATP-binding protein
MARPDLLLIDEFSLGLAPVVVDGILGALDRLRRLAALSMVIVEQDIRVGLHLAARGYVLENGRVVLADDAPRLLENPAIRETYLGV